MIRISLGNVGSGKTLTEVREMFINKSNRKYYSNIKTKLKHQFDIKPSMIINKEIIKEKKLRSGETEAVYKFSLNTQFWKNIKEPINVVLDEAHAIINARRSMSTKNIIVNDWLSLLRRVLGQSESGYGELVLITQLFNRIDNIARDMATQIRYNVCHYSKICKDCGNMWNETSECPEQLWHCGRCGRSNIKKINYSVEVWHFENSNNYLAWKLYGQKSYYSHYFIKNIEKFFPLYNTLQWENMFSDD